MYDDLKMKPLVSMVYTKIFQCCEGKLIDNLYILIITTKLGFFKTEINKNTVLMLVVNEDVNGYFRLESLF